MSKAILVIDMPCYCYECKFLNDNYDYPECIITGETKGYIFRTREQKMGRCPLKQFPNKREEKYATDVGDRDCGFIDGYNTCIDEILGGQI